MLIPKFLIVRRRFTLLPKIKKQKQNMKIRFVRRISFLSRILVSVDQYLRESYWVLFYFNQITICMHRGTRGRKIQIAKWHAWEKITEREMSSVCDEYNCMPCHANLYFHRYASLPTLPSKLIIIWSSLLLLYTYPINIYIYILSYTNHLYYDNDMYTKYYRNDHYYYVYMHVHIGHTTRWTLLHIFVTSYKSKLGAWLTRYMRFIRHSYFFLFWIYTEEN